MKRKSNRLRNVCIVIGFLVVLIIVLVPKAEHKFFCDKAYINTEGDILLKDLCMASPFHEGVAVVRFDDLHSLEISTVFIDQKGSVLFEINEDVVSQFSEGLVAVKKRDPDHSVGLGGYLNSTGEVAIDFQFGRDSYGMTDFSEGLAAVQYPSPDSEGFVPNRWGYIDTNGNFAIPPQFNEAEPFHEGRAAVSTRGAPGQSQWGYIDNTGEWILTTDSAPFAMESFSEGLAFVGESNDGVSTRYFIDTDGNVVIPSTALASYSSTLGSFHDGLARVGFYSMDGSRGDHIDYGYINTLGELAIHSVYDHGWNEIHEVQDFSDGLGLVSLNNGNLYPKKVFIDTDGNVAIDVSDYDTVYPFSEGLAGVCKDYEAISLEHRCGFIDTTGALVIPMDFQNIPDVSLRDETAGFSEGFAVVNTVQPLWVRAIISIESLFYFWVPLG